MQEAVREYKKWAPTPERLDEWMGQQLIPYQPASGDVVLVSGDEFTILEVRGVSHEDGVQVLTIAIEPVRQANADRAKAAHKAADA